MSTKKTDISQIEQYLNGELDARAMHDLEKRAQEDPLLQDALDGYENARRPQQQQLADLQQRLQQRVNPRERSLIPWPLIGIAASVIVVSLAGLLWYRLAQPKAQPSLAANVAAPVAPVPPRDTLAPTAPRPAVPLQSFKAAPEQQLAGTDTRKIYQKSTSRADQNAEIRIDEPVGNAPIAATVIKEDTVQYAPQGYFTHKKTEILGGRATLKPDSQGRMITQVLKSRAEGARVETDEAVHHLTGTLIDGMDGQPLPGAIVQLKDNANRTYTDKNGNFKIAANPKDVLVMSFLGYQSQEIKVGEADSMSIALKPDNRALAEVAVSGYGTRKPAVKAAPVTGWEAYQRLLSKAVSPDHQKGRVKLRFTVNPDGALSGIEVLSHISPEADKAAVDLVQHGPKWRGNSNGKPEQVTLKIDFE